MLRLFTILQKCCNIGTYLLVKRNGGFVACKRQNSFQLLLRMPDFQRRMLLQQLQQYLRRLQMRSLREIRFSLSASVTSRLERELLEPAETLLLVRS